MARALETTELTVKRQTLEDAWYDYFNENTSEEVTVVFSEAITGEMVARPPKPYITLKIISGPGKVGEDDLRPDNKKDFEGKKTGKFDLCGVRSFTLSVQGFGQGAHDSLGNVCTLLSFSLNRERLIAKADIAINNFPEVVDISDIIEAGFERRASMDIFFSSSSNVRVDPSIITKVGFGGTVDRGDGQKFETDENIVDASSS